MKPGTRVFRDGNTVIYGGRLEMEPPLVPKIPSSVWRALALLGWGLATLLFIRVRNG